MTTQIQKTNTASQSKPGALALMASRLSVEPAKLYATLKATVFKNASDDELLALVVVSNEYDLNPLLKEIYAFPAKGGGIVPIVSVDGWNKMILRQPNFDGMEFDFMETEDGKPVSCTATIHIKGRSRPVKITERFNECYRKTDPWENMPFRMLRNRTLCQAARIAFGFAGVYDPDESADMIIDVSAAPPKHVKLVADANAPATATSNQSDTSEGNVKLEKIVTEAGFTFDEFTAWGEESGIVPDAKSIPSFADIKGDIVKRLLRAEKGMVDGLGRMKKGEPV